MKGIKILIFIIVILAVILGLKVSGILSGESSEEGIMTQEEIMSLIKKATEYNNIYVKSMPGESSEGEIFKKDNIMAVKTDNGFIWINNETGETLLFADDKVIKNMNIDIVEPLQGQKNSVEFLEALIKERIIELKYKDVEIVNGRETILVDIHVDETLLKQYSAELEKLNTGWRYEEFFPNEEETENKETKIIELKIDKETGIILDDSYIDFSVGIVTDEDVKKPDLTKYEVIDANEM